MAKRFFVGTPKHTIECAGNVGLFDLLLGERSFVFSYGGEKRVVGKGSVRVITVVDKDLMGAHQNS